MKQTYLNKMLGISKSISNNILIDSNLKYYLKKYNILGEEILNILEKKNGFYAFESALHFYSSNYMIEWNKNDLWKYEYPFLLDDYFFFSEDIFGNQFCIKDNQVCYFDCETGQIENLCDSIEGWAKTIISEYDFWTGYPIAKKWQDTNGSVLIGNRLVPKIPFILGGDYSIGNLYEMNAVRGMRFRGNLARQIKDTPDGSKIRFKITE